MGIPNFESNKLEPREIPLFVLMIENVFKPIINPFEMGHFNLINDSREPQFKFYPGKNLGTESKSKCYPWEIAGMGSDFRPVSLT